MVKKIKKYAKFIVCMGLIMGLMAPSYAALSASDGSAFVTKAEFDSALADFNARLTTFEAGINSKIDSQVTSYLDRNGIWSGKEQVITTNVTDNGVGIVRSSETTTRTSWFVNASPGAFLGGYMKKAERAGADKRYIIIDEINKSGLLCLYYSREFCNTNDNNYTFFIGVTGAGEINGTYMLDGNHCTLCWYENYYQTRNDGSEDTLDSGTFLTATSYTDVPGPIWHLRMQYGEQNNMIQMFVDKGLRLVLDVKNMCDPERWCLHTAANSQSIFSRIKVHRAVVY